jgi:hypothetical protein
VPGKDGENVTFAGGSGAAGTANTYWAGSGSPAAGQTSITLGARNGNGSSQLLNTGDMILIMQMQGGVINSQNTAAYGSGGSNGSGYLGYVSGAYEFAVVRSATNADAGSTITIASANGGGLVNGYTSAAASTGVSTFQQTLYTWQIVRVPQYRNYTVSGNLLTAPWNGSSGGIIALDVAGTLTLSKPIDADGYGFRGGGQEIATGQLNFTFGNTSFDYQYAPQATSTSGPYVREDGYKGEGIMGSPTLVYQSGSSSTATSGSAYPGGNKGRGAPGNAGGGSSENLTQSGIAGENYQGTASTGLFSYNSGGAGGGNGGAGGFGGYGYDNVNSGGTGDGGATTLVYGSSASTSPGSAGSEVRALGGVAIPASLTSGQQGSFYGSIVMGGGGGAGADNDGTVSNPAKVIQLQPGLSGGATFTSTAATAGSGASGGGIIFLRVGTLSGGTLSAQGISAPSPDYDGGGGGGAGGTIVVVGNAVSGVTALAQGGQGACSTGGCGSTSSAYPNLLHGTGGGGGGGSVIYSGTVTATVTGGAPGYTAYSKTTGLDIGAYNSTYGGSPYGATSGSAGTSTSGATLAQVVGARSGAECASLLLAKRVTLVNGASPSPGPAATYVPDGYADPNTGQTVDANPSWPLTGGNPAILGIGVTSPPAPTAYSASVAPGGTLEYTVYFLSAGGKAVSMTGSGASIQGICDFLPANTTIVTNGYGAGKPMQVTIGFASPTTTTYGTVTAQGQTGYYPIVGGTPTIAIPTVCGSVPAGSTGLVFFNQATINPYPTYDGGYGKMQFTVTQN